MGERLRKLVQCFCTVYFKINIIPRHSAFQTPDDVAALRHVFGSRIKILRPGGGGGRLWYADAKGHGNHKKEFR